MRRIKSRKPVPRGDEALLDATEVGDLAAIRRHIAAGANPNAGTKERYPPLFTAAASGRLDVVRELIAAGSDVNQIAKIRWESAPSSPLIEAVRNGHFEIVDELVGAGGKVELEPSAGRNALTFAVSKAIECQWIVSGKAGALAKIAKLGSREKHRHMRAQWMQFVRDVLAQGVRVGDYSLWEAVKVNDEEMALLLIENGMDPNFTTSYSTVLQKAIDNGLTEVALALLKRGANPHGDEQRPPAPILLAVAQDNYAVVGSLLEAGADVNVRGEVFIGKSRTKIFQETETGINIDTKAVFEDPLRAPNTTALIVAVRRRNEQMASLLLKRGADVNLVDWHDRTAFDWAILLGCPRIARLVAPRD